MVTVTRPKYYGYHCTDGGDGGTAHPTTASIAYHNNRRVTTTVTQHDCA